MEVVFLIISIESMIFEYNKKLTISELLLKVKALSHIKLVKMS
jgi:hypothetical protein